MYIQEVGECIVGLFFIISPTVISDWPVAAKYRRQLSGHLSGRGVLFPTNSEQLLVSSFPRSHLLFSRAILCHRLGRSGFSRR